jgi:hypothetical protein
MKRESHHEWFFDRLSHKSVFRGLSVSSLHPFAISHAVSRRFSSYAKMKIMPQSRIGPNFGFVFEHLRCSYFSFFPFFDPPSFSAIHTVIRCSTQSFRWYVLFSCHFAPNCVARWMGSRARTHSFSFRN